MSKTLQRILEKGFDIQPEEQDRALLMQVYIFLIIFTLLIVKPTASSLFITKFGVESLPYAFILVAVLAAIVSSVYARLLNKFPLNRLIKLTLYSCIGSLLLFGTLLHLKVFTEVVLYLFYLWVMIFAVLTTSQFWVLANMVFNSREAKRLFGFIGAGAITGGIFGGYFASFIAQITVSENLLFVAAFCLIPCIVLAEKIWAIRIQKPKPKKAKTPKTTIQAKKHPLSLILESKHLSYLAGIVGLSVMVAKLVDYQFSAIAATHYTNQEELTAFFGFWFSTFNVISLGLQLFLTKRIMESVGVSRALYLMPVFILLAVALMLLMPEVLLVVIFLKMTEGSLKQSVNKAAMELLVLPIPNKVKNSAKTFIDVFIDSLATGLSGLLLIFVIKGLQLPMGAISLIILGITAIWLFLVVKIRKEYLYAFKLKIETAITPTDISQLKPQKVFIPSDRIIKRLGNILAKGNEQQILLTLKSVKGIKKIKLFHKTVKLFEHPSPDVRAAAIRNANTFKKEEAVEAVLPLLRKDDSLKVQVRALAYLLKHDHKNRVDLIEEYLDDDHYQLRGTALEGLAAASWQEPHLAKAFHLDNRLFDWFHRISKIALVKEQQFRKIIFVKAIGRGKLDNYYGHIANFLKDTNPMVVSQAIISAGKTQKEVFLNILVSFLKENEFRASAQEALTNYQEKAFPLFIASIDNPTMDIRIVRALPKIICKITTPQSVSLLTDLLIHQDIKVRHTALKGLNRLKFKNSALVFSDKKIIPLILEETQLFQETLSTLYRQKTVSDIEVSDFPNRHFARKNLIQLIEKRLDINLERLFLLLGLKYSPEDMISIYRSIRGRKIDVRINALEFLDNLLGMNLKKIIIPIIETAFLENLTERTIQQLKLNIPNEYECLENILALANPKMTKALVTLLKTMDDEKFKPLLEMAIQEMEIKDKGLLNQLRAA